MRVFMPTPIQRLLQKPPLWMLGAFTCFALLLQAGCDNAPQDLSEHNGTGIPLGDPAVSQLKIMVLDDPDLVEALNRWQFEWKTLSGGSYTVTSVQDALPAHWSHGQDIVIYPSMLLGDLVAEKSILPIRTRLLEQEEYNFDDVFPLLRDQVVRWEKKTYALSLGSPVFTLVYRADILESQGKQVPRTWEAYEELVEYFSEEENWGDALPPDGAAWQPAVEPLAEDWAGHMLLARAAGYARHRNQISTLFDRETMQPLINTPPYLRALRELVTASGPLSLQADSSAALAAIQAGQCVFALSWPQPAGAALTIAPPEEVSMDKRRIAFAELPGSAGSYSITSKRWEEGTGAYETRVTYLGISGRLGSVSQSSSNAASAMRFLAWLTRAHASEQISAASPATTLFRHSQVATPEAWVPEEWDSRAAREYTRFVDTSLSREIFLLGPRLPSASKYLEVLSEEVRRAVHQRSSPQESLDSAVSRWNELTEEKGRQEQHAAYLQSIGQDIELTKPQTE